MKGQELCECEGCWHIIPLHIAFNTLGRFVLGRRSGKRQSPFGLAEAARPSVGEVFLRESARSGLILSGFARRYSLDIPPVSERYTLDEKHLPPSQFPSQDGAAFFSDKRRTQSGKNNALLSRIVVEPKKTFGHSYHDCGGGRVSGLTPVRSRIVSSTRGTYICVSVGSLSAI